MGMYPVQQDNDLDQLCQSIAFQVSCRSVDMGPAMSKHCLPIPLRNLNPILLQGFPDQPRQSVAFQVNPWRASRDTREDILSMKSSPDQQRQSIAFQTQPR